VGYILFKWKRKLERVSRATRWQQHGFVKYRKCHAEFVLKRGTIAVQCGKLQGSIKPGRNSVEIKPCERYFCTQFFIILRNHANLAVLGQVGDWVA
jgi:hypothetical protein